MLGPGELEFEAGRIDEVVFQVAFVEADHMTDIRAQGYVFTEEIEQAGTVVGHELIIAVKAVAAYPGGQVRHQFVVRHEVVESVQAIVPEVGIVAATFFIEIGSGNHRLKTQGLGEVIAKTETVCEAVTVDGLIAFHGDATEHGRQGQYGRF